MAVCLKDTRIDMRLKSASKALVLAAVCSALLVGGCGRKGALEDPRGGPDAVREGIDPGAGAGIQPLPQTQPEEFPLDPLIR